MRMPAYNHSNHGRHALGMKTFRCQLMNKRQLCSNITQMLPGGSLFLPSFQMPWHLKEMELMCMQGLCALWATQSITVSSRFPAPTKLFPVS